MRPGTVLVHAEEGCSATGRTMTPTGNLSFIQVGEEPRRWMQNDNKNKNTKMNMAEKEHTTDSTATMTTANFTPTTIKAEKEEDTDSPATVTTAMWLHQSVHQNGAMALQTF